MTGRRYGKLLVVARDGFNARGGATWVCECDCGNTRVVTGGCLRQGGTVSCGCYAKVKSIRHGLSRSRSYVSWCSMVTRCTNQNYPEYPRYGGRGITICDRWRNSFEAFLEDMGPRPARMSLDRYPNGDGNYEPGNCRWATDLEQSRNRSYCKLTLDLAHEIHGRHEHGESKTSIARRMSVSRGTVVGVLNGARWREAYTNRVSIPPVTVCQ